MFTRRELIAGGIATLLPVSKSHAAPLVWSDVHLHVIGGGERQFKQAVERAVAEMDRFGLAKAVVFPPPFPRPGIFDYTDYAPELTRYPGRFGFLAGGGTLNPMIQAHRDPASVTPEIRQTFADHANRMIDAGAVGFGEVTALHLSLVESHPFEQAPIDHPLFMLLVEIAGRHKAVIDLHMDAVTGASKTTPAKLKVPPNPRSLNGNIDAFEKLLEHDRDARVVWAHGGSDFTGDMTPALIGRLMDKHPNLYMSLRPLPPRAAKHPLLKFYNLMLTPDGVVPAWVALLRKHPDRFVMGADAFMLSSSVRKESPLVTLGKGNEPRLTAAKMLLSQLPPALARQIGTENAKKLYRL